MADGDVAGQWDTFFDCEAPLLRTMASQVASAVAGRSSDRHLCRANSAASRTALPAIKVSREALALPELRLFVVACGALLVFWLSKTSLNGRDYVKRYIREELAADEAPTSTDEGES